MNLLLIFLLSISIALNIFLIWYGVKCLEKISFFIEAIEIIKDNIEIYIKHLKNIYELEMFYGDETLRGLILHGKELMKVFDEFRLDIEIFKDNVDIELLEEKLLKEELEVEQENMKIEEIKDEVLRD